MTHDDFETRINEVLDERGPLSADEQLRALSHDDRESRKLLEAYAAMLEGVDSLESPQAPQDMGERVVAELTRPAVVRFRFIERPLAQRVAVLAAVAAALLLAAAWWQFGSADEAGIAKRDATTHVDQPIAVPKDRETETSSDSETVATTDAATQEADATENASADNPPLGTMVRDSSEKYAQLVRDTQKSMADLALLFPSLGRANRPSSSPPQEPAAAVETSPEGSPAPSWMNQMNDGLRPLTSATSGAFNMLLRSLPAETKESDS